MDIWEFANKHLQPYKTKGSEINPRNCPYCSGQTKDKYKFFLNTEKQTFVCHRASCGKQGHFTELCRDFGEEADRVNDDWIPRKQFKKPEVKINTPSTKVEQYLAKRKISAETIKKRQVGEKDGNMVFPYYDENNELVFVKYRPARKIERGERKAWREPGGKPILYGMNLCKFDKPLIITEGECDALAVEEAGISNAVSVPSGAKDFTWIDNCWDWLNEFERIVLFGDADIPGEEMVKQICMKLGEERCFIVEQKYKDANELLYREGKEAVKKAVEAAKAVPFEGLIDLADVVPEDEKQLPKIKTNIKWLDKLIGGFLLGEVSVWTGKRGEGKSTFLGQMLLEAIDTDNSVCVYSGELTAIRFQNWIHLQAAGSNHIKTAIDHITEKTYYYLSREIHDKIRQWYKGKLFLYDNTVNFKNTEESSILRIFSYAVKRYDCKMFLVDNLMTAKISEKSESDFYRRQSNFVGELIKFAKAHNVHVHLVAHPNKTKGELENDSVSGSGDITNRADNVFSIERKFNEQIDAVLKIMKCRSEGGAINEKIGLNFDKVSKRFWNPADDKANKQYGWQMLADTEKPEQERMPWDE